MDDLISVADKLRGMEHEDFLIAIELLQKGLLVKSKTINPVIKKLVGMGIEIKDSGKNWSFSLSKSLALTHDELFDLMEVKTLRENRISLQRIKRARLGGSEQ